MDLNQFAKNGKFLMLALDHRGSFKKLMNPGSPESVTDEQVVSLKKEIIDSLKDQFSGVLIDEGYGLAAFKSHDKPFLLPLEKSGYTDKLGERISEIEYTVEDLIRYGAEGAKILLYFNPNVPSAKIQLHTAKKILQECRQQNFPLFLEIRVYDPKLGDDIEPQVESLVLGSLQAFMAEKIVPDVWKLEYPGSMEACQKITQLVGKTPWILLTKGASFDTFVDELKVASEAGCRGFLAGRALWQEVGGLTGSDKSQFLKITLPDRFKTITQIVDAVSSSGE